MKEFVIGDKVKYVSGKHGDSESNPLWNGEQYKIIGVVSIIAEKWISVDWSNNNMNCYRSDDLEHIKDPIEDSFDDLIKDVYSII